MLQLQIGVVHVAALVCAVQRPGAERRDLKRRLGLEQAVTLLRRAFNTQLNRFSEDIDMSGRTEELLRIATDTLLSKLPTSNVVEMPMAA